MSETTDNTTEFDSSLIGQRQLRLQKVKQLRDMGFDPYPSKSAKEFSNAEVVSKFDEYENKTVTLAGRLMSLREHGALKFGDLQDMSGKIQLYIKKDEVNPTDKAKQTLGFDDMQLADIGDIVEVTGTITKTNRGEISILVKDFKILTKTIRPIPNELENKEDRFRRRYLDMTIHPEIRARFARRSKFWKAVREFMDGKGFLEVNIPVLEHTTGGADAKPFITKMDALNQDFYLRISHELPLKRLLGGGFEKVYDVGPRFRNEGIDDEHLPEHVAMEWYWAYADYRMGMQLTQELFRFVMQSVYGTLQFSIKGFEVDLAKEWEEIKFLEVIKAKFGIDAMTEDVAKMNQILKDNGVELGEDINRPRVVDNLWKLIRKTIAGPAFLTEVPKEFSPLAKSNIDNINVTDRFQPIIAGSEMANAYSELNDPVDQYERFMIQERMRQEGDPEAQMLDIDFVEMLEYGMPPACGFGLSERVFWFFENVSAKEGVPFPQLKTEVDNITREIYPEVKFAEAEQNEPPEK